MERAWQELVDREAIRTVLAAYCRGVDRLDAELLRSIYHPDAVDDHIAVSGTAEEFIAWVIPTLAQDTFVSHDLGTCLIELDGDVAHVETYYTSMRGQPADEGEWLLASGGRYIDRFERRGGGPWLIASRFVLREWARRDLIGPEMAASLRRGPRDRTDPAYRRVG